MSKTSTKTEYRCEHDGCTKVCKSKQGLVSHRKSHVRAKMELTREANIEFNIDDKEQANEICVYLKQLETTVGWIYLKKMLKDSMLVIERQIITKKSVDTGEKLTEEEVDALRMSYLAYEELIDKPANLIANISSGNIPTAPEYDPFAKTLKDDGQELSGVLDEEAEH